MKYIKTYINKVYSSDSKSLYESILTNSKTDEVYWIIQTNQPYLRLSLEKINTPQHEIDYWCKFFKDEDNTEYRIRFYRKFNEEDNTYEYSWDDIKKLKKEPDENAQFMGEIVITEEELANEKYNL